MEQIPQSTTDAATREMALSTMAVWVSAIADNVRNPLNGLAAALDILERELLVRRQGGPAQDALVEDAIRRMRTRLGSLGEYVSELVDFAKPAVVYPETVRLLPLLDAVRASAALALPAVAVETRAEPEALTARADPQRLRVVLKALVRNGMEAALAASPQPRVLLVARRTGEGVTMTVSDSGPGFSEAARQRLFEPFQSTKEAGTGLGLAIARKVLEAHGGTLTVDRSAALGGAQISLYLPDGKPQK